MGERRGLATREEALLEELVYAISHIAHAEQHLLEVDSQLEQPLLITAVDRLRKARKNVGEVLLEVAGLRVRGSGLEVRSAGESLWCALKHLCMALVHCDECAEKIARRLAEVSSSTPSPAALGELVARLKEVYGTRRIIRDILIELLTSRLEIPESVEVPRCREDVCEEN